MLTALATPTASSACTLNGQPVSCHQLFDSFRPFLPVFMFLFLLCFIVGIAGLVLTIAMIVHAVQHEVKDRTLWIVLMVIFGPVAALIYYFAVKRPFDEQSAKPVRSRSRARGRRRKS